MKIALIDHYDSFTFNVIDWLERSISEVEIVRIQFDDHRGMAALRQENLPIVLSPGPRNPAEAKQTLDLVQERLGMVPILGVCLGHQILGLCAGAEICPTMEPFHGNVQELLVSGHPLFSGVHLPLKTAVYHSLVVSDSALNPEWSVIARNQRGEVMGLARHVLGEAPALGLQFHPESFMSADAGVIGANFEKILLNWDRREEKPYALAIAPFSMPS
jgi:anthranilate synthase/aminodeoxychorismate synthase-like glutamine amidotransferase